MYSEAISKPLTSAWLRLASSNALSLTCTGLSVLPSRWEAIISERRVTLVPTESVSLCSQNYVVVGHLLPARKKPRWLSQVLACWEAHSSHKADPQEQANRKGTFCFACLKAGQQAGTHPWADNSKHKPFSIKVSNHKPLKSSFSPSISGKV